MNVPAQDMRLRSQTSWLLWVLLLGFSASLYWAYSYRIDEVVSASGEVIASSRVQVIQSVDGGVLSDLRVREGDRVKPGQVLARLDQTRVGATMGEVDARLFALRAKANRLRAEVSGADRLVFTATKNKGFLDQLEVERALFNQRRFSQAEELRTLQVALDLTRQKLVLVDKLLQTGDVSGSEVLNAQSNVNEAEAKLVNRRNKFLEDARIELARVEDDIAQNEQVLTRRTQEHRDAVFRAQVEGIIKNVRVTTVGGVLRAGEELMQIVPINETLVIEAKVRPADIARISKGMVANLRFDPFDYTIYGAVSGEVSYVSPDTIKEQVQGSERAFYRIHVLIKGQPVVTQIGKTLEILPGMTAQVDIRTGDRTILDYLLKPVRKTLAESFGES